MEVMITGRNKNNTDNFDEETSWKVTSSVTEMKPER
jgi:hypothetical protein